MEHHVDIFINGGSFSSPAAALQAARSLPGARVLLIEPTDWLGGQATSQGVSAIDNAWYEPARSLLADHPTDYYAADYLDFLRRLKELPDDAPGEGLSPNGTCWVSRESYDPRSAAWVLENMIREQTSITLMKMCVVKRVQTSVKPGGKRRIESIELVQRHPVDGYRPFDRFLSEEIHDWYNEQDSDMFRKEVHRIVPRDPEKGIVVIDASELADVLVLSGADYVVGRELSTEMMNEDGTPPEMDERGSQSFVYTFCMTGAEEVDDEADLKAPFPDFDAYYATQSDEYFSLGKHTWQTVWTYRRLKTNSAPMHDMNAIRRDDVTMQNWFPGNDYPYGTLYKTRDEASEEAADWKGGILVDQLAAAEKHAIAWHFWLKEHRPEEWDVRLLRGDHPLNMMDTRHGLARFPYIRETRRVIGIEGFRPMEMHFAEVTQTHRGSTSFRFFDSVGIGNYAVDVHPTHISEGILPSFEKAAPFYVPLRALGSRNVGNLLVGGKLISGTYITNAAYRVHPIEWAIGSAAGAAAAMMRREGVTAADLLSLDRLRALQRDINNNSPISWKAFDEQPIPTRDGDVIVNGFAPVPPDESATVEVSQPRAVRVEVTAGGDVLAESDRKVNGRFVLKTGPLAASIRTITVNCYDRAGTLVATIEEPLVRE